MNISEQTISRQPVGVQVMFRRWMNYMEHHVDFRPIPGDIDVHTESHCERVLLHALRIGWQRGMSQRSLTALSHAAIFHDTRRRDNYLDVGHGGRAAQYYKAHCSESTLPFLPEAYEAMKFHDRDDALGEKLILTKGGGDADRWIEVYRVFKDADALDRLRLGTWCLDVDYLRTDEAHSMVDFAQAIVEQTTDPVELERMYRMLAPFKPHFQHQDR